MTRENIFTAFAFGFACILTALVQVHFVGRARMEDMLARNIQFYDFVVYNWQLLLALLIATITGSVTMRSIRPSLFGPIFVGIAFFFFYSTSTLTGPLLLQLKASLTLANGFQVSPVMLKIMAWYAGWFLLGALGIRLSAMLIGGAFLVKDAGKKDRESYRSVSSVFGDARLGKWAKIKKIVSSPNSGMVFGEDYDPRKNPSYSHDDPRTWGKGGKSPLITMDSTYESGHSLVVAGSGGGKTAAYVIPSCLTYRHALVVVDPNGEALKASRDKRTSMGRNVRELSLLKGVNIMGLLSQHLKTSRSYRHLADMMVVREKDSEFSRFYAAQCITTLAGLLEYFTEENDEFSTFEGVATVVNLEDDGLRARLKKIAEDSERVSVKSALNAMINKDKKFYTWFTASLQQSLNWTVYPEMVAMVTTDDRDAFDPLHSNTDLFITLDEHDLREFPGLVRLILGAITYDMMKREERSSEKFMIVDEAALLGYFPLFETLRDRARKYRLHLMLIFQDIARIEVAYGRTGVQEWSNVAVRAYSAIEDMNEAKAISEMIGNFTVEISENTRGASGSPAAVIGQSHSIGLSERTQQAALMTPNEIRELPQDAQVLIFRRQPPLICGKALYFRWPAHRESFAVNSKPNS